MKNGKEIWKTICIVAVFVLILLPSGASAIGVSGAKYMGTISPGETVIHEIAVSVTADEKPSDIAIDVMGFGQTTDQSYIRLSSADDKSSYSARTFISIDNSSIHLEPGSVKTVKATITLPKDVGSGGRYAIIYVHAIPKAGQFVTTAINIPVLITVGGSTPSEAGSITGLNVGDVVIGQPLTVTTSLKNTGNLHYYHTVNAVTIIDQNGNNIANSSTVPSTSAIIPGGIVEFVVNPDITNLPIGTYTVNSKVMLENGKILDEKTTTFSVQKNYIPPLTEVKISLSPANAGKLASSDGRYSISFPQGAVLGDAVVTLKPHSKDQLKAAPDGAKFGATSFEITGLTGLLNKDATIQVKYSEDDVTASGGDVSKLKLAYLDAAQNKWIILPTQVDSSNQLLTTTTNHLSIWAVMVASTTTDSSSSVPASATSSKETPLPLSVVIASLSIAIVVSVCCGRKRERE